MRRIWMILTLLAIATGGFTLQAAAEEAKPGAGISPNLKLDTVMTPEMSLGSNAILKVDGLVPQDGTSAPNLADFVLYFDGYAVAKGADPMLSSAASSMLVFVLQRTTANTPAWKALIGSPTSSTKSVRVALGVTGSSALLPTSDGKPRQATLIIVRLWGLVVGVLFLIAVILGVFALGNCSDFLRDSQPTDFGGAVGPNNTVLRRPYSLAQVQMAWWFALVFAAFIFLYLLTSDFNTLTAQALTLMGIGTGTALGASMIEKTKTDGAQKTFQDLLTRIAQLNAAGAQEAVVAPLRQQRDVLARQLASHDFITDILTDVDGISLHRFQLMAWTVVIGVIFCLSVYGNLALPDFDQTILGVLGISAGTYLGFKVPEQPA